MPPRNPLEDLFETLFENMPGLPGPSFGTRHKCCRVEEIPGGSKIVKEIPGVDPASVRVYAHGRVLVMDTGDGSPCKTGIPDVYDMGSIKADIDRGLLTVTINRFPEVPIPITVAGQLQVTTPPQQIEAPSSEG